MFFLVSREPRSRAMGQRYTENHGNWALWIEKFARLLLLDKSMVATVFNKHDGGVPKSRLLFNCRTLKQGMQHNSRGMFPSMLLFPVLIC